MALPFLIPAAVAIASEVFPLIAARFGGSRGAELAETVVSTAASVVGASGARDAASILAKLRENKAAADELRFRLAELDAEEHRRELEDRRDARQYQIAVGEGGRRRADIMLVAVALGLAVCVGAAIVLPSLSGVRVSEAVIALVTTVAGALLKMLSDAFAFEFGSSKGSKEKDAQIATISAQFARVAEERQRGVVDATRSEPPRGSELAPPAAGEAALRRPSAPKRRAFVQELIAGAV